MRRGWRTWVCSDPEPLRSLKPSQVNYRQGIPRWNPHLLFSREGSWGSPPPRTGLWPRRVEMPSPG